MTTIRRITVSQIDGNSSNSTDTNEIRPFGETAFYLDTDGNTDKLVLMMFDGTRTHLRSKVLSPGIFYGSNADSGDGAGLDTIKLIPDTSLHYNDGNYGNDQYLIVDPTAPNHIHIRAGGTIDNSSADLFIGGEKNFVRISDSSDDVLISTDAGAGNTQIWTFSNNGVLTFPDNTVQSTAYTGSGGDNPFDQDLNTTDSPNFVNLGLAGTAGAGYATLSVTIDRDFYIGLNDTSTGAKTFEFGRDGRLLVPGALYVDGNLYGGAGNRLYLAGDIGEGVPAINIPNSTEGATSPLSINNTQGGGIQIETGAGNWLFDDTRFLHFPSSSTDDYNIGESVDGFNIRSDLSFGIATNFTTDAKYWLFDTDGNTTIPGDIKSEDAINVDINLSDSTLRRWTFGADGILDIPGGIKTSGFTLDLSTYRGIEDAGLGDYTITIDGNTIRSDKGSIGLQTANNYGIVVDENNKQVLVGGLDGEGTINLLFGSESITGENYDAQLQMTNVGEFENPSSFSITTQGDTNVWTFGGDGNLTFPDSTVQTTAWAGGRVVSAPASSTGTTGDKAGDISFNGSYIYYCTANYSSTPTTVSWSSVSEFDDGLGDHYIQATIADPSQLNGVLSITNVIENGVSSASELVTSYVLISGNTYKFYLGNTTEPWNSLQISTLQVVPNIWKRVAWSNDTW